MNPIEAGLLEEIRVTLTIEKRDSDTKFSWTSVERIENTGRSDSLWIDKYSHRHSVDFVFS